MEILNLTSCSWKIHRIAVVAHSFRVMSKARNCDEMIVGLMHHVYGYSRYARGLYGCDVKCGSVWRNTLDLLSGVRKNEKSHIGDENEALMDYSSWSPAYKRKILRIGTNRTARNVMIYDLEDTLDLLLHPEKICSEEAIDNGIFMRELTAVEKNSLIQKYSRALEILKQMDSKDEQILGNYSENKYEQYSKLCIEWYNDWLAAEMERMEY